MLILRIHESCWNTLRYSGKHDKTNNSIYWITDSEGISVWWSTIIAWKDLSFSANWRHQRMPHWLVQSYWEAKVRRDFYFWQKLKSNSAHYQIVGLQVFSWSNSWPVWSFSSRRILSVQNSPKMHDRRDPLVIKFGFVLFMVFPYILLPKY